MIRRIERTFALLYISGFALFFALLSRKGDPSTNDHPAKRKDGPVMWGCSAAAASYAHDRCNESLPYTGYALGALLICGVAIILGGLVLHIYDRMVER